MCFRMHVLWIGYFYELFTPLSQKYGILFCLVPVDETSYFEYNSLTWLCYLKAKARFDCPVSYNLQFNSILIISLI